MTDDLRALSAAATPGPWRWLGSNPSNDGRFAAGTGDASEFWVLDSWRSGSAPTAEFVVALVNAWRSGALTETAPLRALVDEMRTRADMADPADLTSEAAEGLRRLPAEWERRGAGIVALHGGKDEFSRGMGKALQVCADELRPILEAVAAPTDRPALFQRGEFTLASGRTSGWKIECDALTEEDWQALALMLVEVLPPFGAVEGVPRGGLPLASALAPHATSGPLLIADDVWTTGGSVRRYVEERGHGACLVAVAFARGPVAPGVTALFTLAREPSARVEDVAPPTEDGGELRESIERLRDEIATHVPLSAEDREHLADLHRVLNAAEAVAAPTEQRDWWCEADAEGITTTYCTPENPIHSSPCGWVAAPTEPTTCTGDDACSASPHTHGCYADRGDCDNPADHGGVAPPTEDATRCICGEINARNCPVHQNEDATAARLAEAERHLLLLVADVAWLIGYSEVAADLKGRCAPIRGRSEAAAAFLARGEA